MARGPTLCVSLGDIIRAPLLQDGWFTHGARLGIGLMRNRTLYLQCLGTMQGKSLFWRAQIGSRARWKFGPAGDTRSGFCRNTIKVVLKRAGVTA